MMSSTKWALEKTQNLSLKQGGKKNRVFLYNFLEVCHCKLCAVVCTYLRKLMAPATLFRRIVYALNLNLNEIKTNPNEDKSSH